MNLSFEEVTTLIWILNSAINDLSKIAEKGTIIKKQLVEYKNLRNKLNDYLYSEVLK